MAKAKNPIPEGFHTLTPHITVNGAANYIDFLKRAFNARCTCTLRMLTPFLRRLFVYPHFVLPIPNLHSYLNATIGSTRDARRAGR